MKTLLIACVAIVLVSLTAAAKDKTVKDKKDTPTVLLVIARNPVFPGGVIAAASIAEAEAEARNLTSLDPVCFAVPAVCDARDAATTYEVFYSNGSTSNF